jgi:NTE family protein
MTIALRLLAAGLIAAFALGNEAHGQGGRIGLVLGGGGARGGAHLGVLEVLEDLRVPIDCVAGTSMGGLVGGAYAAGVSPRDIQALVGDADWIGMFDDTAGRQSVNLRRKELDDRFYSGLELGVSTDGIRFREGALAGEKLKLFFNRLVRTEYGERTIEQLQLPLSIIATDIGTGTRVAMRTGNLTSAMRASMSVPGLMAPVQREGLKLVDGGLTDNLPVEEVKKLCNPDIIIAVNVGSPLLKPEEVTSAVSVLGQVVNLLTEQNVMRSRALLTSRDIYIEPDLENITSTQFTRQLEAAARGRVAAFALSAELKRYSLSERDYAAWQRNVRLAAPKEPPVIDKVEIAATRFVNPDTLRRGIGQEEGKRLDARELAQDLVIEYSQGDLLSLDYSVVREKDRTILRLTPVEKPWGPNYILFGLGLTSDFRSESSYNLRALFRSTWINSLGAEWLLGTQLGSEQNITTEFYQPLDRRHLTFVSAHARAGLRKTPIFQGGERVAIYRIQENNAGLDAGTNLGVYGQASVGWIERSMGAVLDTGPNEFPNRSLHVGGATGRLVVDTYDQAFFPTRGIRLDATHFEAIRVTDRNDLGFPPYSRSEVRFGGAWQYKRFAYLVEIDGGTSFKGAVPLADAFALGGPRRLAGFAKDQLLGGEYFFGRLETQYRLNFASPLFGVTLIGGLAAEAGKMNKPITETALTGWQRSFSAYLAASTFLGPVYIGVADSKNGKGRFYLQIGTP